MAALANAFEAFPKPTIIVNYKIAASTTIYKGALVGVNANGFLVPMSHAAANLKFVGIAEETVENAGSNGAKSCRVSKSGGGVYVDLSSTTQASIGAEVYAKTDNELQINTSGLTSEYRVGTIVALEQTSTGVAGLRIRIDRHTQ
jgi:hypothetical protein